MQTTKLAYLSNGIKSRVVFAKLALRSPHLLLLDEVRASASAPPQSPHPSPLSCPPRALSHSLTPSPPVRSRAPFPPQPTNGLDIESIDALSSAIDAFQGGVVLVSHDMRLLQKVVKQIFECCDGAVTLFPGDITAYKAKLAARLNKLDEEAKAAGKAKPR